MLNNPEEVLKFIGPHDRVLDIGGATEVFPRANAVIDILPYEARSIEDLDPIEEQFTEEDWYVGDICSPSIWNNFEDNEFDFVICSHVLEDIRDPLFVCSQMIRIGKAGYIETPSRFRECAKVDSSDPVSGWEHHRWIVDVEAGKILFTPKFAWAHRFDYLGEAKRHLLHDFSNQFISIHWIGSFDYTERVHKGSPLEVENLFYFYENYPFDNPRREFTIVNQEEKGKTLEWREDYMLPIEHILKIEKIVANYRERVKSNLV